jgi:hypothetical protein
LHNILDGLAAEGIRAMPFKGPVLSEYVYGDIAMRFFSDLDILVAPGDALKARANLLKNGFIPEIRMDDHQAEVYVNHESDFSFSDEDEAFVIELHWRMDGHYLSHGMTLDLLKPHWVEFPVGGRIIPFISPEMLLVYQCIHGCKHIWESIEQISTINEMMKRDIQWKRVLDIAGELKCVRMLFLGLLLAHRLYGTSIPEIGRASCRERVS